MATILHDSDCAVHNMPASPNGPCDCGKVILDRWNVDIEKMPRTIAHIDLREEVEVRDLADGKKSAS